MPITASSRPLRVLQVAARYFPYTGGSEMHVYEVSRRLARAGVDVTVLTTDVEGNLAAREQVEGVEIARMPAFPPGADYYFSPELYRYIQQGCWDLVHCQGYHTLVAPMAMLAARQARLPYVVSFHSGGHSSYLRNLLRAPQRLLLRPLLVRSKRLVAVSEFEVEFFGKQLRIARDKFVVIPNGAQMPATPERAAPTTDERLIVSIGRLERYKGHQRVIAALPEVLRRHPNARLRIVGGGPYEAALHRLAQKLGVGDRVEIGAIPPADREGMAGTLARASLVTLLSEYEAHPVAVMEALALGRSVLVADTSGLHELAARGWVQAIPINSSSAVVAAAILRQLEQPLTPRGVELPTWDDCARRLLRLYHELVEHGEPARVGTPATKISVSE